MECRPCHRGAGGRPSGAMARQDRRWDTPLAGAGAGVRHLRLLKEPPGNAPMLSPREERPSHSL
ncbi:MAG TPA: hypothetical protein VK458_21515, partial [Myxococcaceae bacterium]|nr:hypothetical protein [Myxococcaceae bacterium]